MCKVLNGKEYINTIGGIELHDYDEFRENGIELAFLIRRYHLATVCTWFIHFRKEISKMQVCSERHLMGLCIQRWEI